VEGYCGISVSCKFRKTNTQHHLIVSNHPVNRAPFAKSILDTKCVRFIYVQCFVLLW